MEKLEKVLVITSSFHEADSDSDSDSDSGSVFCSGTDMVNRDWHHNHDFHHI